MASNALIFLYWCEFIEPHSISAVHPLMPNPPSSFMLPPSFYIPNFLLHPPSWSPISIIHSPSFFPTFSVFHISTQPQSSLIPVFLVVIPPLYLHSLFHHPQSLSLTLMFFISSVSLQFLFASFIPTSFVPHHNPYLLPPTYLFPTYASPILPQIIPPSIVNLHSSFLPSSFFVPHSSSLSSSSNHIYFIPTSSSVHP